MQLFAMAILDLISHVHLPSSVNMLPRYLKIKHTQKNLSKVEKFKHKRINMGG